MNRMYNDIPIEFFVQQRKGEIYFTMKVRKIFFQRYDKLIWWNFRVNWLNLIVKSHSMFIILFKKPMKNFSPGERCTAGTDGIRRISDAFHWNAQETHRKMEAVFQPEFSRIFSNDLRPFPTGKHRELAGIHRKKVPAGILLPLPVLSCRIP